MTILVFTAAPMSSESSDSYIVLFTNLDSAINGVFPNSSQVFNLFLKHPNTTADGIMSNYPNFGYTIK